MGIKKKLTILVDSGFNKDYKSFLETMYELEVVTIKDYNKGVLTNNIDLLVFTGGADVNPAYYGENIGSNTNINTSRDEEEENLFYRFDYLPKLGICRGSQFLTALSGGKLVQHVSGHLGNHDIHLKSSKSHLINGTGKFNTYNITSTHHQMMFPFNLKKENYRIIAWSKRFKSDTYLNGKDEEIKLPSDFVEPEIVYYNNSKSLCIQGHPEFESCPANTSSMILNLIDKLLLNKKESDRLIENYREW